MAGEANFLLIWVIYLASSAVFFFVFWKFSALLGQAPAWLLRTLMAALILTPVLPRNEDEVAVPALMVAALDGIGSGPEAAARGLGALFLGTLFALIVSTGAFLAMKLRRRKSKWRNLRDW